MTTHKYYAGLAGMMVATFSLTGCDKSASTPSTPASNPPAPAKSTNNSALPSASETVANAQQAASDAVASGQAALAGSLQDLGVTLPSFEELRAKAGQSITAQNADAEFQQLQAEAGAEGG